MRIHAHLSSGKMFVDEHEYNAVEKKKVYHISYSNNTGYSVVSKELLNIPHYEGSQYVNSITYKVYCLPENRNKAYYDLFAKISTKIVEFSEYLRKNKIAFMEYQSKFDGEN